MLSRSCDECHKQQVEIVASAVEETALSLVPEEVQRAAASTGAARLPVRFDSVEDEARCSSNTIYMHFHSTHWCRLLQVHMAHGVDFALRNCMSGVVRLRSLSCFGTSRISAQQVVLQHAVMRTLQSPCVQVNLLALLRLLDFGSGWDAQLQVAVGRGAREVTQFGVLGLFISGRPLDAALLREVNAFAVLQFFGVDAQQEQPLAPNLPVTVSRPGAHRHHKRSSTQQTLQHPHALQQSRPDLLRSM